MTKTEVQGTRQGQTVTDRCSAHDTLFTEVKPEELQQLQHELGASQQIGAASEKVKAAFPDSTLGIRDQTTGVLLFYENPQKTMVDGVWVNAPQDGSPLGSVLGDPGFTDSLNRLKELFGDNIALVERGDSFYLITGVNATEAIFESNPPYSSSSLRDFKSTPIGLEIDPTNRRLKILL
jgi:hypothetical protein